MSETKTLLKPVRLNYECDDCGDGNMKPTEEYFQSNQTQFRHRCESCNAEKFFDKRYPTMIYIIDPTGKIT